MSGPENINGKRKFISTVTLGSVGALFGKFYSSAGQNEKKKNIISIHPSAVKREIKG